MPAPQHSPSPKPASYTWPAVATLGGLVVVEALSGAFPPAYLAYALALAVLLGQLWAVALSGCLAGLARIPKVGRLVLPAAALAGAYGLAASLHAFARLEGRYRAFAIGVLVACGLGGLALAALFAWLQGGFVERSGRRVQVAAAGLLGVAGVGLLLGDRMLYVGLYPVAHLAMRGVYTLLLTVALSILWKAPRLPRRRRLVVSAGAVLVLATLDADDDATLQAFAQRPYAAMLLRATRSALDLDRDGFSAWLGGGDCDDFNRDIFPAAREVPGNGIDDNCYLGDATPRQQPPPPLPSTLAPAPLDVVLITVDTLRWDRLGSNDPHFGAGGRNTMPRLSAFAERSVNFTRAYAPGSWTSISLGALMRGRAPRKLTWVPYFETNAFRMLRPPLETQLRPNEQAEKMFPLSWDDPNPCLPAWLRARGMRTIAVVDDGFSQMLAPDVGAARGFEVYEEVNPKTGTPGRGDAETTDVALAQLEWAKRGRSFFLWVHYFGPHAPDVPHPETDEAGEGLEWAYDNEARFVDMQIGRILDALQPRLDRTAVFVTADHGEAFFPTYRSHGMDVRETLVRIPLVAHVPGWRPGDRDALVSLLDLMPTILAVTDTPAPPGLDGTDLTALGESAERGTPAPRLLHLDNWYFDSEGRAVRDAVGVHDGSRKLMLNRLMHGFTLVGQAGGDEHPLPEGPLGAPHLLRGLMAYVEETGGRLSLVD